jgi:AraC-like DNA-binding protein
MPSFPLPAPTETTHRATIINRASLIEDHNYQGQENNSQTGDAGVLAMCTADEALARMQQTGLDAETASKMLICQIRRLAEQLLKSQNHNADMPKSKLVRSKAYIEAHLEDDLRVHDIAGVVKLSPFHFSRAFRQNTGLSPHQFLTERRIARARELLGKHNMSISDIAYSVGFSSQAHMTTVFRKCLGITPGMYRKQKQIGLGA